MNTTKRLCGLFFPMAALIALLGIGILSAAPAQLQVISRNCPAFASSGTASAANDSNYGTTWRGTVPGWIAYDLSEIPSAQRGKVAVVWYNNDTYDYDHTIKNTGAYNSLKAYTVEGNAASGNGNVPASGWIPLVTVTGNTYHSRQHVVDLTGYNWLRLRVTESDGSSGNTDASINLDVHNAAQGVEDDWIFYGDSITAGGMGVNGSGNGTFAQMINAKQPEFFPIAEGGGIGALLSSHGAQSISTWLKVFPGKYVGIAYGTNDAWGNQAGATVYYNNLETMVKAVLAAGKTPVIPKIPWARLTDVQTYAPQYNAKIDALYAAYPQVVKGPDLWTFFQSKSSLISSDGVHPTADGYNAMRQLWADTMLSTVYSGASPTGSPTPSPSLTPTPISTPTSSPNFTGYSVAYVIQNSWGVGATITVTITNNGSTGVNGWTLAWTFPGNQTITNLWNGVHTQSGAAVTVKNSGYNASIPANGGSVTFGFNINYSGANSKPDSFTLNGAVCGIQ